MADDERSVCALDSVTWYESMFRSHSLAGEVADGMWTSGAVAPPYYSNAVTLSPSTPEAQTVTLCKMRDSLRRTFTVKDSFSSLGLAPFGFRPMFDAEWIWRDPSPATPRPTSNSDWRRVVEARRLEEWEAAWRDSGSPADSRVFVPSLLADETVAVFEARRGSRIVAGCVANRSAGAVGFSNYFAEQTDADRHAADAVGEVVRLADGAPVVGYHRGEALERMLRLGFRSVGPLRVWLFDGG